MVDGFFGTEAGPGAASEEGREASALRRGNFAARMRMAVLYDRSVTFGGLVVGTGNKTESLIGYTTLFGDSACAFNPIGDLYKSQVRQLAVAVGVPDAIVRKAPSADLWPGQTDEIEGGFSYPQLDRLLFWRIDKRRSIDEMVELGFDRAAVERVDRLVAGAEFKRQVPPIAKLGPRTTGVDYLYPRRRPGSARG
jgi:NAD+ synthase